MTAPVEHEVDVAVIGGGPAGLSAALNAARARFRTLVLDGNRPRHAATLVSHGFLTRDGISPLELRALGRAELDAYTSAAFAFAQVETVTRAEDGFVLTASGVRGEPDRRVRARTVVLATGLLEKLPNLPGIRAYYGTALHSCLECDGYEKRDEDLVLLGAGSDLLERAVLMRRWARSVTVCANGPVAGGAEAFTAHGVRVDERPIAQVAGDRSGMTGIVFADGAVLPARAGFVRPEWSVPLDFFAERPEVGEDGYVLVDAGGRTSEPGLYAAGDIAAPGPGQLIEAAGAGARVARSILHDLLLRGTGAPALSGSHR